jgi:hypothetical protein
MLVIAQQPDQPPSAYYALRYFTSFPREDVAPALIAFIEARRYANDLYDTVAEFIKSPNVADKTKATLSALITSRKLRK